MMIAPTDPMPAMAGKTVLLRADLSNGVTHELGHMAASFAAAGARVAVIAGYGAPEGDINAALSLARFRGPLERISGRPVTFIPESVGPDAEAELNRVPFGEIALMENLRFHPDERRNTRTFAIRLSALGDYFAISGFVPPNPIGWLTALAAILPAPYGAVVALPRKES
jgi:phosphoglycerate kinase